jgi:hypothetical protein
MFQGSIKSTVGGFCLAVSLFLTILSSANAQGVVAGSAEAAGSFGYSSLSGVDNKRHFNYGAEGAYNLSDKLAVAGEYTYMPMGSAQVYVDEGSASESGKYQQFGGSVRYSLTSSRHVVPFVVGGFGFARQSATASINLVGIGSGSGSADLNGVYYSGGGGVSIYLHGGLGVRPEARYERQEFYQNGQSGGQNLGLGTVSVFYQFGGKKGSLPSRPRHEDKF